MIDIRAGRKTNPSGNELQLMRDLVTRYGSFQLTESSSTQSNGIKSHGCTVLLTGATGSLGAHILSSLRSTPSITKIICLVRASSPEEAKSRVNGSLSKRRLPQLPTSGFSEGPFVECLPMKLGESALGLSPSLTRTFQDPTTLIIHAAWAVNFSMRLQSFENEHVRGLRHILDLMLSAHGEPARLVFCSSVASMLGKPGAKDAAEEAFIPEAISSLPETASELGYSRSKWVAEAICNEAHKKTKLHGKISVVRIGQLCGDTENGVWNASEAWPTMLSSVAVSGCLPDLRDETLGWLAVDLAAKAVIEIGLGRSDDTSVDETSKCAVYHVLNTDRSVRWADMLDWIRDLRPEAFQIIGVREWVARLEGLDGKDGEHPAKKLLGLWKNAYCRDEGRDAVDGAEIADREGTTSKPLQFSMQRTKAAAPVMRDVRPVTKEHFAKLWRWVESDMIGGGG